MEKSDVRRILAQHDISLTDTELDGVLLRLTRRANDETYLGGRQNINTDTINNDTYRRQRPTTGNLQSVSVAPSLPVHRMIPRTAPMQLASSWSSSTSPRGSPSSYLRPTPQSREVREVREVREEQPPQTDKEEEAAIAQAPYAAGSGGSERVIYNTAGILPSRPPSGRQQQQQQQQQQVSKIAQMAVNEREEYFDLRKTGDPGTVQRAPWQSQKKQYKTNPTTVVVGGLDAVFRMAHQSVVDIDNMIQGSNDLEKVLPPDVVIDPATNRFVALPHQRRRLFEEGNDQAVASVPIATRESKSVAVPRIIEMDGRKMDPLSGRKTFRANDAELHASGGWAVNLDYRDVHQAPWTTTNQHPLLSYRPPLTHDMRKRELHPAWDGPTIGRVVVPIGPPPERPRVGTSNLVNSPRLAYQKRVREMNNAVKNWDVCQSVDRTSFTPPGWEPKNTANVTVKSKGGLKF